MDWTKNYSAAELKKQQQNFIREALEMAKKSVRNEPEPVAKPVEKTAPVVEAVQVATETVQPVKVIEAISEEAANILQEAISVEKKQETITEDELTKYSPEPLEKEAENIEAEKENAKPEKYDTIELKSNLERLIEQITEERRHDDTKKPQCNCPACQKKRMGK